MKIIVEADTDAPDFPEKLERAIHRLRSDLLKGGDGEVSAGTRLDDEISEIYAKSLTGLKAKLLKELK